MWDGNFENTESNAIISRCFMWSGKFGVTGNNAPPEGWWLTV